jgi:hypothetical protein
MTPVPEVRRSSRSNDFKHGLYEFAAYCQAQGFALSAASQSSRPRSASCVDFVKTTIQQAIREHRFAILFLPDPQYLRIFANQQWLPVSVSCY